jgi:hypothetical protein
MTETMRVEAMTAWLVASSLAAIPIAEADVITDWNARANAICAAAKLPPPSAYRAMAIVQTATYEAVKATTPRHRPDRATPESDAARSVDAAVAAANRAILSKLIPSQKAAIDKDYESALAGIPESPAKTAGIAVGEQASAAVLASRVDDGATAPESYRPRTMPGVYVPTAMPAAPQWPSRKAWVLSRADQFRPGPPPSLASRRWARDYNEIRQQGAKNSSHRPAQGTEVARFWETTAPAIYYGVVKSVAETPGREPLENARLYAAVSQAMDDALIAVFDAKYHYGFWRPITAIRNGDRDGNSATQRDSSWVPLVETPMHPEYPCAHCTLAGAVGAVIEAEIGPGPMPQLSTTSATAPATVRRWTKVDDFVQEVADARVYDGVHYRTSTEVGTALGKKVGALVTSTFPARHAGPSTASARAGGG